LLTRETLHQLVGEYKCNLQKTMSPFSRSYMVAREPARTTARFVLFLDPRREGGSGASVQKQFFHCVHPDCVAGASLVWLVEQVGYRM